MNVRDPRTLPTHLTTESGLEVPASFLLPGYGTAAPRHGAPASHPYPASDAAAHGSLYGAPDASPPAENPAQTRLRQAREDLRLGIRRDPRDLQENNGI